MQKLNKDGAIEDVNAMSDQKPIQKVSLRQLQETDHFNSQIDTQQRISYGQPKNN